ncbi:MAG TPA: DNA-formamidopyrimidine glycosylase [Patescibacteria group bacterium]|jgi:formamidopyrimidine-DNA glycosylase|nr:DNA-formamidopyrimidine glycosylase [Patescibacteria group bacterium]
MPELPEVETIKLGLQKCLVGHKIEDVEVRVSKIFQGTPKDIIGAKVIDIKRIGKGLIIELNNGFVLTVHLKMTGQLVFQDKTTENSTLSKKVGGDVLPSKYSHVIFSLDKGAKLYYNDLRRFGWVKVLKKEELKDVAFFNEMGPEPKVGEDLAGKELTLDYFKNTIQKGNLPVKLLLMDQKKIGGIGNIYANDALFLAGIDPRRKGKTLTDEEIEKLFKAIYEVIRKSLSYGGSSDENFVNVLGQEGNYQNHTLVYGKKGEKCSICGATIEKIQLGGRGTYFCPKHQR